MKQKKVLVIGAGIHGCSVAIELAKQGMEVIMIDAKKDIFLGSSGATHNRIHLGYHYPKSKETAIECKKGYYDFIKNFKKGLTKADELGMYIINSAYMNIFTPSTYFCTSMNDEKSILNCDGSISKCYKVQYKSEDFKGFLYGIFPHAIDVWVNL